jgi:hypothetical protein
MILVEIICQECGKKKKEGVSSGWSEPAICSECKNKKEEKEKRKFLEKLEGLSYMERIRRIEEKIYDIEKNKQSLPDYDKIRF